ncbi:MAG TPA: type II secretion system minor pseudopilin GspI [Burkholderiaceae bacterium]|nr:type II secretion system minor pseudopilin GspI [Burkholderiaceae bacterium]
MSTRSPRGFTLIEIMVALAVVALTLGAGIKAAASLTQQAQRQTDQWLAQLCAENELARLRLSTQWPGIGESDTACEQGGRTLRVRLGVQATPNPNFRRIEARVDDAAANDGVILLSLSTVLGRY